VVTLALTPVETPKFCVLLCRAIKKAHAIAWVPARPLNRIFSNAKEQRVPDRCCEEGRRKKSKAPCPRAWEVLAKGGGSQGTFWAA